MHHPHFIEGAFSISYTHISVKFGLEIKDIMLNFGALWFVLKWIFFHLVNTHFDF